MPNSPLTIRETLLRLPEVLERVPVKSTAWWTGVREGYFPKPVRLGPRMVAWKESDIDHLVQEGTHG
ncbi:MAG: AlpA family phage regulatory protein [Desulfoplanes sp.]|nr:AlpA family phage regulatory protein [Desulfoplanes sp.]MDD4648829.1 AlpA family phage regulatory protein [Desulfoplanes sp.]